MIAKIDEVDIAQGLRRRGEDGVDVAEAGEGVEARGLGGRGALEEDQVGGSEAMGQAGGDRVGGGGPGPGQGLEAPVVTIASSDRRCGRPVP